MTPGWIFIFYFHFERGMAGGSTKDCGGGVRARTEIGDMSPQRGGGDTSQIGNVFQRQRCFKSL